MERIEKIKGYLKQPSTYRGLALLLTLTGVAVAPEQLEIIGAGVIGLIGIYETLRDEKR